MRSAGIRGRMQKLVKRYPTLRHVMVLLTGTAEAFHSGSGV